jgi:hypothetical protein
MTEGIAKRASAVVWVRTFRVMLIDDELDVCCCVVVL